MDRSEPTLVPEWLKGTGGGGAGIAASHHNFPASQSDNSGVPFSSRARPFQSQLTGSTRGDYDSPRYSGSSDRPFHSSSRRGLSNNSGSSERANTDRDPISHSRAYASFRRSSSVRASDSLEHEKDWDWDREREVRDREKSLGAIGNDRNISREIPDASQRWLNSGPGGRVEGDLILRRSRSFSNRNAENEVKQLGNELQNITMAPPMRGGLVGNMQKAAFERNFPSLGSEERQGTIQSNLTNVSVLNSSSSSIWQGQRTAGRSDLGRTSSAGLTIPIGSTPGTSLTVIGVDGWKSALADVPVPNEGLQSNGPSISVQQVSPGNLVLSKGHGHASGNGLNMAEALVQNPARPRTPQLSVEVQRLEEWALKQSRQLIPVTPSMPKTMGLSPSEKSKAKSLRSIDTSTVKATQSIGPSHLINSPKLSQGGKLLVLKPSREIGPVSVKPDGASPVKGGNATSSSFGSSGGGAVDSSGNMVGVRKHKLFAENRANSLSSLPTSSAPELGARYKEGNFLFEEKKTLAQAQNRSDFFNALRRKASESHSSTATQDKSSSSTGDKADEASGKVPLTIEDMADLKVKCSVENIVKKPDIAPSLVEIRTAEKDKATLNGFISGQSEISIKDTSETSTPVSTNGISVKVGSEEEEAAFLRSLGWEENAGGEEALTEEEINSFYQEHMRTVAAVNSFRRGSHRLWNLNVVASNVESMSSGIGSSELA